MKKPSLYAKLFLTGDRPIGKLHLGTLCWFFKNRVALQNEENTEIFVMIADQQHLLITLITPGKVIENITGVAPWDYLWLLGLIHQELHIYSITNTTIS